MADMLNSGHFCLERQDSIDNPSKVTPKQRKKQWTPRAGPTESFFKKVTSQQRAHLRDIKTAPNAIEISLFKQYIQLATLRIFLSYISLAFLISCKFFINLLYLVIHFNAFVAPQNMQLTGTTNQKLHHINCKTHIAKHITWLNEINFRTGKFLRD